MGWTQPAMRSLLLLKSLEPLDHSLLLADLRGDVPMDVEFYDDPQQ